MQYVVNSPTGLFDAAFRREKITALGDQLEKLNAVIPWEMFRPQLESALYDPQKRQNKGGRPPYDPVVMFKALVLQHFYGLSDEQTEYQILDRLSFQRFLGLELSDRVPDARTIWLFKEKLSHGDLRGCVFFR